MYLAVLPNMLISLHPDYVMTHLLTPISAGKTRIRCSWAFPRTAADADGFDPSYAVDFWDLTNRQDWAACESVQRGMTTPGYRPGRSRPPRTASTTSSPTSRERTRRRPRPDRSCRQRVA